MSSIFVR